ncbi:hypothetical protein BDEG_26075 [Batrachochytrium dendrobatidis JEL423]|uniref:Uncharacterized protein n=1 Tax=Batrachochytrium dendrobatidis (strain JEL423) TaxID=403673 RepID=A0A177WRA0_BATDL|nr:hypothetical protein BDEG_26075 [Batrachochytrium dendrobatidis JEL423]
MSENGYQFNDVGVGCSNGEPGGDPRWNSIKDHGLIQNPLDSKTVWPIVPTVAVSEFSWGGSNKDKICYQTLNIRNAHNHSQRLTAYVVDFCPTKGCMWSAKERQFNVDIYGQRTFSRLGGALMDGIIDIEIQWPTGIIANSAKNDFSFKTILIVWFNKF